jgi:hypothetical protein
MEEQEIFKHYDKSINDNQLNIEKKDNKENKEKSLFSNNISQNISLFPPTTQAQTKEKENSSNKNENISLFNINFPQNNNPSLFSSVNKQCGKKEKMSTFESLFNSENQEQKKTQFLH